MSQSKRFGRFFSRASQQITTKGRRIRRSRLRIERLENRRVLAAVFGNFNGDRDEDLGIWVSRRGRIGAIDTGAVNILYGSFSGLATAGNQFWSQNVGMGDRSESGDRFGEVLAAGDFNGDGDADLAIGIPGEGVGAIAGAGTLQVLYGSGASGLNVAGANAGTRTARASPTWRSSLMGSARLSPSAISTATPLWIWRLASRARRSPAGPTRERWPCSMARQPDCRQPVAEC